MALVSESNHGTNQLGLNILFSGQNSEGWGVELFGYDAYFWTTTLKSENIHLALQVSRSARFFQRHDGYHLSVRCIKDAPYPEDCFGENRTPCTCQHGTCNDGLNGDGTCISCEQGWYGENCDICTEGFAGEDCNICAKGFTGKDCNICADGYYGDHCVDCSRPNGQYSDPDTEEACKLTDSDGVKYQLVRIGDLLWMGENYRRKVGTPGSDWYHAHGDENNDETYGLLYSYETLQSDGFCPQGWHLPSGSEFEKLRQAAYENSNPLIEQSDLCAHATNALGFGARFAGTVASNYYYYFNTIMIIGGTDLLYFQLWCDNDPLIGDADTTSAYSVRCIMDHPSP